MLGAFVALALAASGAALFLVDSPVSILLSVGAAIVAATTLLARRTKCGSLWSLLCAGLALVVSAPVIVSWASWFFMNS